MKPPPWKRRINGEGDGEGEVAGGGWWMRSSLECPSRMGILRVSSLFSPEERVSVWAEAAASWFWRMARMMGWVKSRWGCWGVVARSFGGEVLVRVSV